MPKNKIFLCLILFIINISCKNKEKSIGSIVENNCSKSAIETEVQNILKNVESEADFSFYVEDKNGFKMIYNRGNSTMDTIYKSASTSKWVSSAIIMNEVEKKNISLDDAANILDDWAIGSSNLLYSITLSDLLSFNSGLISEPSPNCLNLGISNFFECVSNISEKNQNNQITPGNEFYYSGTHLQVAGAMIIKKRSDIDSWNDLFNEFKTENNLFSNSTYSLPSSSNPRLAGGMKWTGNDYVGFLRKFWSNGIISNSYKNEMIVDRTLSVSYSPILVSSLNEDWHYGYGLWLECQSSSFNCSNIEYISSPGAYGSYPFINIKKNFFGIVARQGSLGTFPKGVSIYRSVKDEIEKWSICSNN